MTSCQQPAEIAGLLLWDISAIEHGQRFNLSTRNRDKVQPPEFGKFILYAILPAALIDSQTLG
jgi:hypothetical protein